MNNERKYHQLEIETHYLDALIAGTKTFEVRKNDRFYQKGDVLEFERFSPTRCETIFQFEVLSVFQDVNYLQPNYCILSLTLFKPEGKA